MLLSRPLEPLRSADYRRLWLGQLISVMGDKVDQIALGILVYEATGSELQMGIVLAISMLPAALFGMIAGAYVDRFDKRRTMIAADVARAALVMAVPFVAEYSLAGVYAIALAVASVALFFEPAKLSLIPELVGPDDLMAANSLDNATVSAAELVGLAFAAGLVASVGYRIAFYFDAVTFLFSAVFIMKISHRSASISPQTEGARGVLLDVFEGLRYIVRHEVLRDLLPIYSIAMAGVAASVTFIYVMALDRFAAGAPGLAALDGAITVGLLLGSVAISWAGPGGATRKILWGLMVFAVLLAASAAMPSVAWTIPLFVLMGVANMFFYVPMATVVQTASAPSMRGRAFAAKQTLGRILSVIGLVGAGALIEGVGLSPSILLVAGFIGLVAIAGWTRPSLRTA
ncbi:MAG: MFS transporter [Coriobacteriia bacterium]|nr:MFS transporter [Coriobacteriia bacterium]